ncbi:MAG: hypothetical protein KDB24_12455 [Microthrixaceae bacterium]|nr:hypothetical protein [Microthrixaceae bacterium]
MGRRAVATLALLAGSLSGVITTASVSAGAAPVDIDMICTGDSGDVAATTSGDGFGEGVFDSRFIAGFLSDPSGASPLAMVTVSLDHDLPEVMLTDDPAAPVNVGGTARLSDAFFEALTTYQVEQPFAVDASTHARLDGLGVSTSEAGGASSRLTQPPAGPGVEFPVNLALTATPTATGGGMALHLTMDWKLHFDQAVTRPVSLDLRTVSMTCESAGAPHDLQYPYPDEEGFPGFAPAIRLAQPVADGFVATPGGVVARTDRAFEVNTSAMVPVLDNDESLDPDRVIDPSTLTVVSTGPADHWDAEVMVHGGELMVTPKQLRFSDLYTEVESGDSYYGGFYSPPPGIVQTGFGPPMLSLSIVYEVCDDGDPASCARGLAEVTVGVDQIDPCEDPTIDLVCGPYVPPEPEPTCDDDMSLCEVPGCTWSEPDDRYVCTYPGSLQADPGDPPSGNDPPSSSDDPPSGNNPTAGGPDGNGPGDDQQPSAGDPLTPAFTA